MQKTSCAALGLGSAMLLMMRYKAVRMSAGYLGDILHVDAGGNLNACTITTARRCFLLPRWKNFC